MSTQEYNLSKRNAIKITKFSRGMNLETSATHRKSLPIYWSYLYINIPSRQRVWYTLFITRGTHQIKLTFRYHSAAPAEKLRRKKSHSVFCLVFEWCMSSHHEEITQQAAHWQDWSSAERGRREWGRRERIWSHNYRLSDNAYTQRSHIKIFFIDP